MRKSPLRPSTPRQAIDPDEIVEAVERRASDASHGEPEFDEWDEPDLRFAALEDGDLDLDDEPEPDAHDFWPDDDNDE